MCSGKQDVGSFGGLSHLENIRLEPVSLVVLLPTHLLLRQDKPFDPAQVHNHNAPLHTNYLSCYNVAFPLGELLVDHAPFLLTELLHNHLFGRLCRDAAKTLGLQFLLDEIPYFVPGVLAQDLGQGYLRLWVVYHINDFPPGEDFDGTAFAIEVHADVVGRSGVLPVRRQERRFQSLYQVVN